MKRYRYIVVGKPKLKKDRMNSSGRGCPTEPLRAYLCAISGAVVSREFLTRREAYDLHREMSRDADLLSERYKIFRVERVK